MSAPSTRRSERRSGSEDGEEQAGGAQAGPGEAPAGSEEAVATLSLQLQSGSKLAPCLPHSDLRKAAEVVPVASQGTLRHGEVRTATFPLQEGQSWLSRTSRSTERAASSREPSLNTSLPSALRSRAVAPGSPVTRPHALCCHRAPAAGPKGGAA